MKKSLILLLLFSAQICSAHRHHKHHRPKPSHASQIAQNQVIEKLGLPRIKDSQQLGVLIRTGRLVPLRSTEFLSIDPRLPRERRYCLAFTLQVLSELSAMYYDRFGKPLVVTSAVRTLQVQMMLLRINRAAAPLHGEAASSHPTGASIDIARKHMTTEQDRFLEGQLSVYSLYNKVIYIKERACYHIMAVPY